MCQATLDISPETIFGHIAGELHAHRAQCSQLVIHVPQQFPRFNCETNPFTVGGHQKVMKDIFQFPAEDAARTERELGELSHGGAQHPQFFRSYWLEKVSLRRICPGVRSTSGILRSPEALD